jgi:tetratricopeptide (TPR) repeat protein
VTNIRDIKKAQDNRDFALALAGCDDMLMAGDNPDVLRLRASTHFLRGDGESAFDDYALLINWGADGIGDFFMAAQSALYINNYKKACEWLEAVLSCGEQTGNRAFDTAAWLMLAFGRMHIADYDTALHLVAKLKKVTPNISLPVPHDGHMPMLTLPELSADILRRQV